MRRGGGLAEPTACPEETLHNSRVAVKGWMEKEPVAPETNCIHRVNGSIISGVEDERRVPTTPEME